MHLLPTVPFVDFLGGPEIAESKNYGFARGWG